MKVRRTRNGNIRLTMSVDEAQHVTTVLGSVSSEVQSATYHIFSALDDEVGNFKLDEY